MTERLRKMLRIKGSRRGGRKKKSRKRSTGRLDKDKCVHRGVRFAPRVGLKKAMDLLASQIQQQRHKVPAIDLSHSDPASQFMIAMYDEISSWDDLNLRLFISEITGAPPRYDDTASMLGTAKSIFHAIFTDKAPNKDEVLRYDSKWKMWPNIVRREDGKRQRRSDEDMATKQATKKKVSKKVSAEKSAKKSARRSAKKKTTKKSKRRETGSRLSPITDDTKLVRKKAKTGERPVWDDFLEAMGPKPVTFRVLCTTIAKKLEGDEVYTRRIVGSLRRRKVIVSTDE